MTAEVPNSIRAQRQQLEERGHGPNVGLMIGHGTIRQIAMGSDYQRLASNEEIEKMKESIREGMEAGALGISAGLEYVPGRWSNTREVIDLVSELKQYGGVYIVHERSSGSDPMWYLPSQHQMPPTTMLDNIREVIEVAQKTGVPTCATHIKVRGADYWGVSTAMVQLISTARAHGVDVWADQYPYNTTGSDGNTVLIPGWALDREQWGDEDTDETDYSKVLMRALRDRQRLRDFETDVTREVERRGGAENIVVMDFPIPHYVGKTIAQICKDERISPMQVAINLQTLGWKSRPGGARLRGFSLSELDIEIFAPQPWLITASDAGIGLPDGGPVHARFYGTFPRKIAKYAKERGVISR